MGYSRKNKKNADSCLELTSGGQLSSISIAVINIMIQRNLGKEVGFILHFHISLPLREVRVGSQARTWRQELKQTPWKKGAYWLTPQG